MRALALAASAFLGTAALQPSWAAAPDPGVSMSAMSRSATSMAGPNAHSQPAIAASALRITGAQHVTVYVLPGGNGLGFTGPDGAHHDTVVPSSFVLRKGVPITLTVINLDDMSHSITAPGLRVNIIAKPGADRKDGSIVPATTTYTFTPTKRGEFRWFCGFPCDMPTYWAMSAGYDGPDRDGFMAGSFLVL